MKNIPLYREDGIVLPSVSQFNAEDELVVGKFNIRWVSDEFCELIAHVVEKKVLFGRVLSKRLNREASTKEISRDVGKKHALFLVDLARLLIHKEESFLTIVLVKNKFWAVYAYWYANYRGWNVYAYSVMHPNEWSTGDQVVSRKNPRRLVR